MSHQKRLFCRSGNLAFTLLAVVTLWSVVTFSVPVWGQGEAKPTQPAADADRGVSLFDTFRGIFAGTPKSQAEADPRPALSEFPEGTYQPARYGRGELRVVNHVPVLLLRGTPEEMAAQEVRLTAEAAANLVAAPQEFLDKLEFPDAWQRLMNRSKELWSRVPEDYKRELTTLAKESNLSRDELFTVNVLPDLYRNISCSSLIVLPERSASGKMVFGRNLDFFSPRKLYRFTVVKVYYPEGKRHRFVSIGFPGFVGCLTGMNDAGLCLAVHEVHLSADRSPIYSPEGVPYSMMLRRVMENCSTVEEAVELLKQTPRTTLLSIALCDRNHAAVAEITPRQVVVRESENGVCICTNHFLTPPLRTFALSWRHAALSTTQQMDAIDLELVKRKMHEVNLGFLTIQSVVMEPADLVIHLAAGPPPATRWQYHRVELASFLTGNDSAQVSQKESAEAHDSR